MIFQGLINHIEKYNVISEHEKNAIIHAFTLRKVRKKEILIEGGSSCDKLFFVNKGLLRTYYFDKNLNEFTRRIAWEGGFLTNMDSFRKQGKENLETIECIEDAEILQITYTDLEVLLSNSENLRNIYQSILEKYMAINIRRFQHISTATPLEKLEYFYENYPALKNRISNTILATFLLISRKTLLRTRKKLLQK